MRYAYIYIYINEIHLYAYYDYYVCVQKYRHRSAHICTHLPTSAHICTHNIYVYIIYSYCGMLIYICIHYIYITSHHITSHYIIQHTTSLYITSYIYTMLDIIHYTCSVTPGKRLHSYGFFTIF